MELLKKKIVECGKLLDGDIIKVDMFLNHQLDVCLLNEIGKEFKRLFPSDKITKILTAEASGIAVAAIAGIHFGIPVVFAKKGNPKNICKDAYTAQVYSYTKNTSHQIRVSREYLTPNDRVLIIDDFLANGQAVKGLLDITQQSGASLEGIGIVIEKGFQEGGKIIRERGINLKSLAIIDEVKDGKIIFR
ncbi:MAG: xanthine phosphoribosyltransferase [Bacillota bacterium]|nr:xanthine phosphoribosyltransferase [Bacillota bacterium]